MTSPVVRGSGGGRSFGDRASSVNGYVVAAAAGALATYYSMTMDTDIVDGGGGSGGGGGSDDGDGGGDGGSSSFNNSGSSNNDAAPLEPITYGTMDDDASLDHRLGDARVRASVTVGTLPPTRKRATTCSSLAVDAELLSDKQAARLERQFDGVPDPHSLVVRVVLTAKVQDENQERKKESDKVPHKHTPVTLSVNPILLLYTHHDRNLLLREMLRRASASL